MKDISNLPLLILISIIISPIISSCQSRDCFYRKGKLLYENNFKSTGQLADWIMEGPGLLEFIDGWMHMFAPDEKFHQVFWCLRDFPGSFIA